MVRRWGRRVDIVRRRGVVNWLRYHWWRLVNWVWCWVVGWRGLVNGSWWWVLMNWWRFVDGMRG